jgi:replicative DNA helicase
MSQVSEQVHEDQYHLLYSLEAEMCALGAALLSERATDDLLTILEPRHYFREGHRLIHKAIATIRARRGAIDFVTVKEQLMATGNLADIGGDDYLIQVAEYTPGPVNSEDYCRLILDRYRLRAIYHRCRSLASQTIGGQLMADEAYAKAGEIQRGLEPQGRELFSAADIDLTIPTCGWVPSGIPALDAHGNGGGIFPPGHLSIIGGLSGHGKTAVLTQVVGHLLRQGYGVLYATLEQSATEIKRRVVKSLCGWDECPRSLDLLPVWDAANAVVDSGKFVIWDPSEKLAEEKTVEAFTALAVSLQRKSGPYVVLVDYAQLFSTSRRVENKTREMDAVANALFNLAKTPGPSPIPVIAAAQMIAPKAEDPRIADSSQFRKNSALTLMFSVTRPDDDEDPLSFPTWRAAVKIDKTRNGRYGRIPLSFRWSYARFEDPNAPVPEPPKLDPFAD